MAYSATLAGSGGTPPYTWSLASGQLHTGLSLSASGVTAGLPTAAGSYSFTIQVNDSGGQTASRSYSASIASPLGITTTSLSNGMVNVAYSDPLSASGGTLPYTWSLSAGSLPAGVTLSSSGTISGTATIPGSYSFTIQVSDSGGQNAPQAFGVTIYADTSLDQYGGVTQQPCPNGPTGEWYTQQIGKRWVFCDPLGNAFIYRGVYFIIGSTDADAIYVPKSYNTTIGTKGYTNGTVWFNAQIARIKGWNFNGQGPGAYQHATDSGATAFPFVENAANSAWYNCTATAQCKNLWNLRWPALYPYDSNRAHNITDAYEPTFQSTANSLYAADSNFTTWATSNYAIGFSAGDSDNCSFCSAGVDFPNGVYWGHGNYWIMDSAPHAWLNPWQSNALFTDQTNYSKAHWSSFLASKYGTIWALNTAWGTGGYYTTFGTSGIQVTGTACATGNGGSSYGCTPHTNIDRFSLRVSVGGTPVCADNGAGRLVGPSDASCGSVAYSSGAITITKTVSNGVAITVDFWHDGYGVGTGVLDEWGDPSVHAWVGDPICLNNGVSSGGVCNAGSVTTAAYRADMDAHLQQYVTQFFTVLHNAFVSALPTGHKNKLFLGIDQLGQVPGRVPARCPVLAGVAAVADVLEVSTDTSTAQLNFISSCIGNKPFLIWESVTANADSDSYGHAPNPQPSNVATQAARATQYSSDITNLWSYCNSTTANCQWVGEEWWSFLSTNFWEHQNFGLVSWRDNAYDGHEDVTGSVACSAPLASYTCGGERKTYGNFLGPATDTNNWVDTQVLLLK